MGNYRPTRNIEASVIDFLQQIFAEDGGWNNITVEKTYNKASQLQFGWLYAVCYPIALKGFIDAGIEDLLIVDDVDLFFKIKFANKPIVDRETGERVNLPLNKSAFKTVDEMTFGNKIVDWCEEWLGLSIPPPDPNYKNKK